MTIIFDNGQFWIEVHLFNITIQNAAGRYLGTQQNMDRKGKLVGLATFFGGVQGIPDLPGSVQPVFNGGGAVFSYGLEVSNINAYTYKGVGGTNGNVDAIGVLCFMRI